MGNNLVTNEKSKLQTIEKYFIYFLLYSVVGWLYEVFIEYFILHNGFVNRGVLFGPYCPVYGVGTLVFLLCFGRLMKMECSRTMKIIRPFLIFIGCMVVATVLELLTSYALEFFTGSWPWDYFKYDIQFQGRIALSTSVRFGLGGVLFLYLIQPLFEKLTNLMSKNVLHIVSLCLFVIFAVDFLAWILR